MAKIKKDLKKTNSDFIDYDFTKLDCDYEIEDIDYEIEDIDYEIDLEKAVKEIDLENQRILKQLSKDTTPKNKGTQ